jgi:hypothetical protein
MELRIGWGTLGSFSILRSNPRSQKRDLRHPASYRPSSLFGCYYEFREFREITRKTPGKSIVNGMREMRPIPGGVGIDRD